MVITTKPDSGQDSGTVRSVCKKVNPQPNLPNEPEKQAVHDKAGMFQFFDFLFCCHDKTIQKDGSGLLFCIISRVIHW